MQKLTHFYYFKKLQNSKNPFEFWQNLQNMVVYDFCMNMFLCQKLLKQKS